MSPWNASHPELSPDDHRLLDALVEAGFDIEALEGLSPDQRRRAEALGNLFGLLSDYPAEDADDTLIHATLARIGRHEEEQAARMSFEAQREAAEGNRRRIRMPDFITVAAALLIAASVLWPIISHSRQRSIETACSNNLRIDGFALSNYASDYNGALPMVMMAGANLSWDTGRNMLNLDPLVEGGYCDRGHLDCPGNHERPSYSYQLQSPENRLVWDARRATVVLGDRNPIIDAARSGAVAPPPLTISLNHGGRGQNVLISDGATLWLTQPVVGQDNIWLPDGATALEPRMRPAGDGDVFLTH